MTERHCVDHYIQCYLQNESLLPDVTRKLPDHFVGMYLLYI